MDDNPYSAPRGTHPRYFTDDITFMPTTAIWRILRRKGWLNSLVLFPFFLGRKVLRLRFPANHASYRPTELAALHAEQVPANVQEAFAPFDAACQAHGMKLVRSFRPPWIGNKSGVFSLWLNRDGTTYCNATWIDLRLGSFHKSKAVFACHSRLASGIELHTCPMRPEDWIPELVPPNQDIMRLGPDTAPELVIAHHYDRIANRTDVIRFDGESLVNEIVRRSQELFDYLVAKRVYVPVTEEEVSCLMSVGG